MNEKELKGAVQEKYSAIANSNAQCCATGDCSSNDYTVFKQDYQSLEGYYPDADLGLGCGLPTAFASIKNGDLVVDLGSGAGNDCFIAARLTGPTGRVIGIDFSAAMVRKANQNAKKLGLKNVRFFKGEIEELQVPSYAADVVISNCVLNLVPNKRNALSEIYRILKNQGHFSISDIVIEGVLPMKLRQSIELYCGCVSGALSKEEYIQIIQDAGFKNISIQKETEYPVPDDILLKHLTLEELEGFKQSEVRVLGIHIVGEKLSGCGCCC